MVSTGVDDHDQLITFLQLMKCYPPPQCRVIFVAPQPQATAIAYTQLLVNSSRVALCIFPGSLS